MLEDHCVAHVCGHHERRQRFQRQERVFQAPDGIAKIEARRYEIFARFFDDGAGLARLGRSA